MRRLVSPAVLAWVLAAACNCGNQNGIVGAGGDAGPDGGLDGGDAGLSDAGDAGDAGSSDGGDAGTLDAGDAGAAVIALQFGTAMLPTVQARVIALLTAVGDPRPVEVLAASASPATLPPGSLALGFGDTLTTGALISAMDTDAQGSEGFVLRSGQLEGVSLVVVDGNPPSPDQFHHGNSGLAYGTYALLEQLGFAFLHPLAPTTPTGALVAPTGLNDLEAPRWPVRGIHLHTIHPLELCDLLNGWGPAGDGDDAGWQAEVPTWDLFLEWMLANRLNRVEWVLLEAADWEDFARSPMRLARLTTLAQAVHDHGLTAIIDASIELEQQHAFQLLPTPTGDAGADFPVMDQNIDYLMDAGVDYLSTESGTSEFTNQDASWMLGWMNEFANHLSSVYGATSFIKVHCSTGQTAGGFTDPDSGMPLNYNFLPEYAVPQLGVMPHTVEDFGLDDPAPTYGNTDFSYMRTFLEEQAGKRPDVFYPETAYWVTFDIDVPLFLPLYAERRVHDLRLIAADEAAGQVADGGHIDGQFFFSSGWEWGYWLNDVVAARSSWNPHREAPDDATAFADVLAPVGAAFGAQGPALISLLNQTAQAESDLLIYGIVNGVMLSTVIDLNGNGYLEGWDTWDEIGQDAALLGFGSSVIPTKLGLESVESILPTIPSYSQVSPLLSAMDTTFNALAPQYAAIAAAAPANAADLAGDLADSSQLLALRATQEHGLYDYASTMTVSRLTTARQALDTAQAVVTGREAHYRVPATTIDSWTTGPTAYTYRYLWPVHHLYFWWRDEAKAVLAPLSPCYLNIDNPVDVGFGEGTGADAAQLASEVFGANPLFGSLAECLGAPTAEPALPPSGVRDGGI